MTRKERRAEFKKLETAREEFEKQYINKNINKNKHNALFIAYLQTARAYFKN